MGVFSEYIAGQFRKPKGLGGKLSTFLMNRINQRQYESVINEIQDSSEKKVLDIGFGNGYLLEKLTERKRNPFFGIEISEDMVKEGIRRNQKAIERKQLELKTGDVQNISFSDGTFAYVYTVNTIYFWSDLKRGLEEIYRVLEPGGKFINVGYTKEWMDKIKYTSYGFRKDTLEELEQKIQEIGFQNVKRVELKKGASYFIIGEKK